MVLGSRSSLMSLPPKLRHAWPGQTLLSDETAPAIEAYLEYQELLYSLSSVNDRLLEHFQKHEGFPYWYFAVFVPEFFPDIEQPPHYFFSGRFPDQIIKHTVCENCFNYIGIPKDLRKISKISVISSCCMWKKETVKPENVGCFCWRPKALIKDMLKAMFMNPMGWSYWELLEYRKRFDDTDDLDF